MPLSRITVQRWIARRLSLGRLRTVLSPRRWSDGLLVGMGVLMALMLTAGAISLGKQGGPLVRPVTARQVGNIVVADLGPSPGGPASSGDAGQDHRSMTGLPLAPEALPGDPEGRAPAMIEGLPLNTVTVPSPDVVPANTLPSPSDPDRAGDGVTLIRRFASERDPMERMQAQVACTAVCEVQAVVAPKAYLTIRLNVLDHLGQVSLDQPEGWSVKGYYVDGIVPTLRVEDVGTLAGRPPGSTWLRVRTTGRTISVHLRPETAGTVALPVVQVNDGQDDDAGWLKDALPGNGPGM